MARLSRARPYHETEESLTQTSSPGNSPSDKENRHATASRPGDTNKRSQPRPMAPDVPDARNTSRMPPNKRQRLGDRSSNVQNDTQSSRHRPGNRYYDPNQNESERRELRKGLRDLSRELHDSRNEYIQAGNDGIRRTVEQANGYFEHVKQTSDATIDSRLLVNAADLSYKKAVHLAQSDGSAGVDVDEFVSKCIAYMRQGPPDSQTPLASSSQRRRPPASSRSQVDPDDSDEDQGDSLNWERLGRAAVRYNARPAVSGFLLGPLAVQKRTRQQTQRRAKERIDPSQTVQPQDLRNEDLDRQETSNLTTMCTGINKLLARTQAKARDAVEHELSRMPREELTDGMRQEVMEKHNLADDEGVPFFRFCINPRSFGQTVENLFYLSFLIRDSTVGVAADSQGLPTLHSAEPMAPGEAKASGIQKRQSVFSLDFDIWQELIELLDITECIIPHRDEEERSNTRQRWQ